MKSWPIAAESTIASYLTKTQIGCHGKIDDVDELMQKWLAKGCTPPTQKALYAARCPAPAMPATGKVDAKIHEVKGGAAAKFAGTPIEQIAKAVKAAIA